MLMPPAPPRQSSPCHVLEVNLVVAHFTFFCIERTSPSHLPKRSILDVASWSVGHLLFVCNADWITTSSQPYLHSINHVKFELCIYQYPKHCLTKHLHSFWLVNAGLPERPLLLQLCKRQVLQSQWSSEVVKAAANSFCRCVNHWTTPDVLCLCPAVTPELI